MKKIGIILSVIVLVILSVLFLFREKEYNTEKPLNLDEASRNSKIILVKPIPDSAEKIYFYSHSQGLGAYTRLLRFSASKEDNYSYAKTIMTRIKGMKRHWQKFEISPGNTSALTLTVPVKWFTLNSIKNGVKYIYTNVERNPQDGMEKLPTNIESIYIDDDKGILYYFQGN